MQNKLTKALELNKGSIADINQITTISKLRIFNPRRKEDTLSNVTLDSKYMDQINNKIKELFDFDKNNFSCIMQAYKSYRDIVVETQPIRFCVLDAWRYLRN